MFICPGNIARQISDEEEYVTREAVLGLPEDVAREHSLGECLPPPPVAGLLFGARLRIGRSEARGRLSAFLWLTSLPSERGSF